MPKTRHKHLRSSLYLFLALLYLGLGTAQETPASKTFLISYIQELEKKYDIKFSFVDEDIRDVQITIPKNTDLEAILNEIQNKTQIKIQKLSERYFTMSKSTTVDICARVLDNFENNTLTGATVQVLGSSIAVITDLEGNFSLENIPRKAIIQIKHIGFKPLFVVAEELVNPDCTTIVMAQTYQQLDEVVLVQFLTTGLTKQIDGSIQLNTSKFGILPGLIEPDVLQTVQALPGIESIDETVSDINIRGGSNDQNLILWDGIKMYQSGHFFGLISAFNPHLTDKVILIKNGSSAQYGDGVSGVIDMHTKNEIEDYFTGGVGFNLLSTDAFGQIPLARNLGFQFSARRSMTDFFDTGTYGQFRDRVFQDSEVVEQNENFYFYDFTAKILYDISDIHKFRLSFININNSLDFSETNEDSTRSSESQLDQTNLSFGGNLESNWNDSFSTHINAYFTRYNLDAQSITANQQQQLFQNNQVLEKAVKLTSNYKMTNTISWMNGYQLTETGIANKTDVTQPPFNSKLKDVLYTHSVFSEVNYNSDDETLMVRAGGRFNYFKNLETFESFEEFNIEPRLNINYEIAKNIKVELLGEFKSQATNQVIDLEQNFLGIEKRRWILSDNDSLPITQSKQVSLGLNYDHHSLYIGIEGFYKEVKGISTRTQGFQNQNQFNGEIGQYDVKGIEFLINKKTSNYSAWLSYAFNVNNYAFKDVVPSQFPNNLDIRHTLTFAGTYTYNNFRFGIGINYRTGKPFTEPLASNPINTTFFPFRINYDEPNSSRLPDYLRADASAIYDFKLSRDIKASAGASVLNFINRRNILNTFYRLNDADEIETVQSVSLGLTPNFSFRVWF